MSNIAYGVGIAVTKSPKRRPRALGVYSNLATKRRTKKDAASRKHAEYLASLPKHPVKRFFYRLSPKHLAQYWFSKRGAFMALKLLGAFILLVALTIGAVFAYYRKDLENLNPDQLASRVQTTVTKYFDRNGKLLWEDKGTGDYRLVVKSNEINNYMKQATVAIEDRDFYKHDGVSFTGITRSFFNNLGGGDTQGGSTLTQQLVKQVFLADQANLRGINGVPRKIKEMILAIEAERMYSKDQILTMYLNESSYGGRRNGVESGAQTYFGKPAKDLSLSEAALLAAIPNSPSLYDPYTGDHQALLNRQHLVLDDMVKQGNITKAQADAAKAEPILDTIKKPLDQTQDVKAPHFVLMVKHELESELGKAVVGQGGLTITTSLDLDVQTQLESSMNDMFNSYVPAYAGFKNGAGIVEDVKTGQVLALLGSRAYDYPGFGQDNAATAFIQPGSTIKPLVYAQLFQNQGTGKRNWGAGSIMPDVPTTFNNGTYKPQNFDQKFDGPSETIHRALARSRNIPAISAMDIAGKDATWATIRAMGDTSYCTDGGDAQAGLSSAIGGCGAIMTQHVNAISSLARYGAYVPQTMVLEVKNSQGTVLKKFTQPKYKQVIDQQSAYMVNYITGDGAIRKSLFGYSLTPQLDAAGIKVSLKTGTSDIDTNPKDLWNVGYTPDIAMAVWLGNPDPTALKNGNSGLPSKILDPVMAYTIKHYADQGILKTSDWWTAPKGIQIIGGEPYPSYYNKSDAQTTTAMTFDRASKKKATDCTPDSAKIQIQVPSYYNPISKQTVYSITSDGYDPNSSDDVHNCADQKPTVNITSASSSSITVSYTQGTFQLTTLTINVNGNAMTTVNISGSGSQTIANTSGLSSGSVTATVTDQGYYSAASSAKNYP